MVDSSNAEFHLHLGVWSIPEHIVHELLKNQGFRSSNFVGDSQKELSNPPRHFSKKIYGGRRFRSSFIRTWNVVKASKTICGYLEGELLVDRIPIAEKPDADGASLDIETELMPPQRNTFHEAEIHISMCSSRTDDLVVQALRNVGFISSYVTKTWGLAHVLTLRGSRQEIDKLKSEILPYLQAAGGLVNCTFKLERVARWWTSNIEFPTSPILRQLKIHKSSYDKG